jgi:hypothetical protein
MPSYNWSCLYFARYQQEPGVLYRAQRLAAHPQGALVNSDLETDSGMEMRHWVYLGENN